MGSILWFIGAFNAIVFYAADLCLSFTLSRLKQDHPAIDEAADYNNRYSGYENIEGRHTRADETPLDPVTAVLAAAKDGKGEFKNLFENIRGIATGQESMGEVDVGIQSLTVQQRVEMAVHLFVIVISIVTPFFCLIQILFPSSVPWSMWYIPSWLGFLVETPGLMVSIFYAARAARIGTFAEVTKVQWLSYSWFRMDVMSVMGLVLLLGWGNWVVALSIFINCSYLSYRLMRVEKRLQSAVSSGQLMGDGHAVNIEPVMSGFFRGAIHRGYQDLDSTEIDIEAGNIPARNVYGAAKMTPSQAEIPTDDFMAETDSKKKKKKKRAVKEQTDKEEGNEVSE